MDIYNYLFIDDGAKHFITLRPRYDESKAQRRPLKDRKVIESILRNTRGDTDVFITKYSADKVVKTLILDFDSDEDKQLAYRDVMKLRYYLKNRGVNCFVVDSTNKGYHCYINIVPLSFANAEYPNELFRCYVECLLKDLDLPTLDEVNTSAGLQGNIRLIGSIHPSTKQRCEIVKGECIDATESKDFEKSYKYLWNVFEEALRCYWSIEEQKLEARKNKKPKAKSVDGVNPEDIDLRVLMQEIFDLESVRDYNGHIWCSCPFHENNSVNFSINEDFFFCTSCGKKGNVYTLIKDGYFNPYKGFKTDGAKKLADEYGGNDDG